MNDAIQFVIVCLVISSPVLLYTWWHSTWVGQYRIEKHFYDPERPFYEVHKALGPVTPNWSWSAVYTSSSRQDCEGWIRKAKIADRTP